VIPMVIKSGTGGILFHEACGHGLEADHIVKDSSVYPAVSASSSRARSSPSSTTALVRDNWGSAAIDDEGRPSQRNVLIENGVLTDYMWDYLRARKEGRSLVGQRQAAELPAPADGSDDQHLPTRRRRRPRRDRRPDGHRVYVAQLGGGQVNTATGDFVFGMTEAYLIEDGDHRAAPEREPDRQRTRRALGKIDAIGNDFGMCPGTCGKDGQSVPVGCGQPTLRITGVTVGGTADA
jgi:TldD protein